jgi:hypothetical protein
MNVKQGISNYEQRLKAISLKFVIQHSLFSIRHFMPLKIKKGSSFMINFGNPFVLHIIGDILYFLTASFRKST